MSATCCVLFEFDSHSIRVGFAGEMSPRVEVKVNLENVSDDNIDTVLSSVIVDLLQIKIKGCQVLVVEPLLCSRRVRDMVYRAFVHSYQLASICMMPDMVMPLLATGSSSGLVVQLGRTETTVVAFLHGRLLRNSIKCMSIGVVHACDRWHALLCHHLREAVRRDSDSGISSEAEVEVHIQREYADRLFFQSAGVDAALYCEMDTVDADDPDDMDSHWHSTDGEDEGSAVMHFHSRPGQVTVRVGGEVVSSGVASGRFSVPQRIRHECLQCLIDGRNSKDLDLDDEHKGVLSLLLASLDRCCHESRAVLLRNIVFSGDGALITGLSECICAVATNQLRSRFEESSTASSGKCVLASTAADLHPAPNASGCSPSYLVWTGASVYASIKGNDRSFVSVAEILAPGNTGSAGMGRTGALGTRSSASVVAKTTKLGVDKDAMRPVGNVDPRLYEFSAPDWMSAASSADDVFAFVLN